MDWASTRIWPTFPTGATGSEPAAGSIAFRCLLFLPRPHEHTTSVLRKLLFLHQAKRLLRPGGCFAFSVEAADGVTGGAEPAAGYRLEKSGRYRHAAAYLDELARDAGFTSLARDNVQVRVESGIPAPGWMVLWRA